MSRLFLSLLASTALSVVGAVPAMAQQTTGTPGAPSATTTIDGNYLPPPPPRFGGEIGLDAKDSEPYWPPQVVPPKGAPNILLIMTDDAGYGVSGTFGGVIPTPALDRVAIYEHLIAFKAQGNGLLLDTNKRSARPNASKG